MTFFNSIKTCYMKSFDFKGRASKSEYWWFWLFQMVLGVLTYYTLESDGHEILKDILVGGAIASTPASLSVFVRRLHDVEFGQRGCLARVLIFIVAVILYPFLFNVFGYFATIVIFLIPFISLLLVLTSDSAYGSDDEKE